MAHSIAFRVYEYDVVIISATATCGIVAQRNFYSTYSDWDVTRLMNWKIVVARRFTNDIVGNNDDVEDDSGKQ